MATFITIGYGDRQGYEQTDPSLRDAAHAHDARLRANHGALMGVAGDPVQVRNHDNAEVRTTQGPFMRSDLPIAGFAVIEADSAEQAAELVSETPCAVAHGVVEVWPLPPTLRVGRRRGPPCRSVEARRPGPINDFQVVPQTDSLTKQRIDGDLVRVRGRLLTQRRFGGLPRRPNLSWGRPIRRSGSDASVLAAPEIARLTPFKHARASPPSERSHLTRRHDQPARPGQPARRALGKPGDARRRARFDGSIEGGGREPPAQPTPAFPVSE